MTTYNNIDYETSEALREAINVELSQLAYPYKVKHKTYGVGQLTFVKAPLTGGSLYATVDFSIGTKTLSVDVLLANQLIELPEILMDTLLEAQTVFKADFIEREETERHAARLARIEAEEAKKKAIEDQKAEEAYERQKTRAIHEFETISKSARPISSVDEFYYSLGWLANHVGSITARLPDYLGSAFEKCFGTEAPKTLIDGKTKSAGGYAKQWSWAFTCGIKKLKDTTVPAYIQNLTADVSKGIHNTSFIWDLVENYGFQFGRTQDIDIIRSKVPTSHIKFFEAGLAA